MLHADLPLVRLIDKQKRKPVYTDFEDRLGTETHVVLPGFTNKPLTAADLVELEQILRSSGAKNDDVQRAKDESQGLGLFVCALVGMERDAAKQALSSFLAKRTLSASQIEFMDLIVDQLTEHGAMEPGLLYESPFVDVAPRGPNDLFDQAALSELFGLLEQVRASALAS